MAEPEAENNESTLLQKPRNRLTEISDAPLTSKERTYFIIFGIVCAVGLLITFLVVGVMGHLPGG